MAAGEAMDLLRDYFRQERERVIEPPADFGARVLSRAALLPREQETAWDAAFATGRQVLAAAVVCIVVLMAMNELMPALPGRGPTQIYLESELNPDEQMLYLDAETPPPPVLFQELIAAEEQ
jgi:hypothetical protein